MKDEVCVCLLRGINVSGKNMIRMPVLQELFSGLGYRNIATYVQSGNIVFTHSGKETGILTAEIEKVIKEKLNLEVPAVIRTRAEIKTILENNPFYDSSPDGADRLYVTMLKTSPSVAKLSELKEIDFSPEKLSIRGLDAYIFCPDGYGRAKLNNNFIEKKSGSVATTRNWKTINALNEMMGKF
ncbi:MAG: DUF1697 domain-containing protein [Bacteroidales bacterium]